MRFIRSAILVFSFLLCIGVNVNAQTNVDLTGAEPVLTNTGSTGSTGVLPSGNIDGLQFIGNMVGAVLGNNYIGRFVTAGKNMSANVNELAMALAGVIGVLTIIWDTMMNMKDDKPVLNGLLETMIYSALIIFLIQIYPTIIDDFMYLGTQVMQAATGTSDIGVVVVKFISGFIGKIFTMIGGVWHGFSWTTLTSIPDAIFAAVFSIIAAYFALFALVHIVEVALIGPITFALGIVLGPLFIATLISGWTRSWFQSWINFMVNAACITAILGIVVSLVTTVVVEGNALLAPGQSSNLSSDALATALLAYVLGKVFSAVPGYADALLPGRTGAGGGKSSPGVEKLGKKMAAGAIKGATPIAHKLGAGAASIVRGLFK